MLLIERTACDFVAYDLKFSSSANAVGVNQSLLERDSSINLCFCGSERNCSSDGGLGVNVTTGCSERASGTSTSLCSSIKPISIVLVPFSSAEATKRSQNFKTSRGNPPVLS